MEKTRGKKNAFAVLLIRQLENRKIIRITIDETDGAVRIPHFYPMVFTDMEDERLLFEAGHELPHETVVDTPSGDISTRY